MSKYQFVSDLITFRNHHLASAVCTNHPKKLWTPVLDVSGNNCILLFLTMLHMNSKQTSSLTSQ